MAEITKCQQQQKKKNSFYTSVWNTYLSCACVSKHHLIRLIFPENTTIRVTKATSTRSTSHNCKERKAVLMTKKPKWRMPCHEKKCSFQYLCCNISHQAITYLQRSHSLCLKSTTLLLADWLPNTCVYLVAISLLRLLLHWIGKTIFFYFNFFFFFLHLFSDKCFSIETSGKDYMNIAVVLISWESDIES